MNDPFSNLNFGMNWSYNIVIGAPSGICRVAFSFHPNLLFYQLCGTGIEKSWEVK